MYTQIQQGEYDFIEETQLACQMKKILKTRPASQNSKSCGSHNTIPNSLGPK